MRNNFGILGPVRLGFVWGIRPLRVPIRYFSTNLKSLEEKQLFGEFINHKDPPLYPKEFLLKNAVKDKLNFSVFQNRN
jgi:hypothetical protein